MANEDYFFQQSMNPEDDLTETLTDKLRCGDYNEMIQSAQKASDAQHETAQLCLRSDGHVSKADPHIAFAGVSQVVNPPIYEDADAEMRRLRAQRMSQFKDEAFFKKQGHGSLRELANEREFVEIIQPHERAVVLLDDGQGAAAEDVKRALETLAKKHLETQFCVLPVDKALFLTHMVELEGLPAIFVLRDGLVTRHLPPSRLFQFGSSSSPLFTGHLAKLLHRVDAMTSGDGGSSCDEEEEDRKDRRSVFQRA